MSQQGYHIPKFGNWDNDNVPYTAYFENARSERSFVAPGFNPNDPQDNPEAFMLADHHGRGDRHPQPVLPPVHSSFDRRNMSTEKNHADIRKGGSVSGGYSLKSRNNPSDDFSYTSAASVPKFGEWDERDPTSGDGFTVIFNKLKEEKHIAPTRLPTVHQQNTNFNTNKQKKKKRSKICCCFSWGGR